MAAIEGDCVESLRGYNNPLSAENKKMSKKKEKKKKKTARG